jgi:hypothetical protein
MVILCTVGPLRVSGTHCARLIEPLLIGRGIGASGAADSSTGAATPQ